MARRIVDCTKSFEHGSSDGFVAHEFERSGYPQAIGHRIKMETDTGTYVLAPRRYARWGSAIADLPIATFFGEGVVGRVEVDPESPNIDAESLETAFGPRLQTGDIAVLTNTSSLEIANLTAQATQWLLVKGAKLIAIADDITIGDIDEPENERVILNLLLESNIPVVRGLLNTDQLSSARIAFMALPALVADVTAWPVRFVALDPGPDPRSEQGLPPSTPTTDVNGGPDEPMASSTTVESSSESDSADSSPTEEEDMELAIDEESPEESEETTSKSVVQDEKDVASDSASSGSVDQEDVSEADVNRPDLKR